MSTFMSLFILGAAAIVARRIYKKYREEKVLNAKFEKIELDEFQEWLRQNRIPKLEQGDIGDVVMRVFPEDRENHFDSNIKRWSRLHLQSSWGFYGTGPHLMAEDILFQFTGNAGFSQWGEPVRALVEEQVCFVPLSGGTIKKDAITAIIARYWDKYVEGIHEINRMRQRLGLDPLNSTYEISRPSFLPRGEAQLCS